MLSKMASLRALLLLFAVCFVQVALPSLCVAGTIEKDCACPSTHSEHEEECATDPCQISMLKSDLKGLSAKLDSAPQPVPQSDMLVLPLKELFQTPGRGVLKINTSLFPPVCAYPANNFPLLI